MSREIIYDKIEYKPLTADFSNGVIVNVDCDITLYSLIVIPLKGRLDCGKLSMGNGILVIDGFENTSYLFSYPTHPHDVWATLIKGYPKIGLRDAEITSKIINDTVEHIRGNKE